MANLATTYLGLGLKNPLVVASCSLSGNVDGVKKIADAGAGAVVLKSLFEEQMEAETKEVEQYITHSWHTEAYDYVRNMGMELGPNQYLKLVEQAKKAVSIPVIASLNCISTRWWSEYATKLENAGADALELNVSFMPSNPGRSSKDIEQLYFSIVENVKSRINIPVAVKIGPYFTSMSLFAQEMFRRGVDALVLFNRFYQVDIDTEKLALKHGYSLSSPEEITLPLRWIALLSDKIECDFAATTGVYDGEAAIKMLLAGAKVVQVCSTLYKNGLGQIKKMNKEIEAWMKKQNFETVDQFCGKLNHDSTEKYELLERLQYIKALVGFE